MCTKDRMVVSITIVYSMKPISNYSSSPFVILTHKKGAFDH